MVYPKNDLFERIEAFGIRSNDTVCFTSSMKAIGEVGDGADTLLGAFIHYLKGWH